MCKSYSNLQNIFWQFASWFYHTRLDIVCRNKALYRLSPTWFTITKEKRGYLSVLAFWSNDTAAPARLVLRLWMSVVISAYPPSTLQLRDRIVLLFANRTFPHQNSPLLSPLSPSDLTYPNWHRSKSICVSRIKRCRAPETGRLSSFGKREYTQGRGVTLTQAGALNPRECELGQTLIGRKTFGLWMGYLWTDYTTYPIMYWMRSTVFLCFTPWL